MCGIRYCGLAKGSLQSPKRAGAGQLADGPCTYRGRPMLAAHAGLETTQAKFNAVAEGMQAAMAQAGVPYWTQNRMMARLAPLQRDIVNR